ncbi:site-specific integrase [Streptomyces sp. NBC_01336]|nr:site-specific integrase [Streptomyces sp. NBC_01336]
MRLVDGGDGQPVTAACRFLDHLVDRGFSPHTICAYAYDLRRLFTFLAAEDMDWREFRGPDALRLLAFLRRAPSRRPAQRLGGHRPKGPASATSTSAARSSSPRASTHRACGPGSPVNSSSPRTPSNAAGPAKLSGTTPSPNGSAASSQTSERAPNPPLTNTADQRAG